MIIEQKRLFGFLSALYSVIILFACHEEPAPSSSNSVIGEPSPSVFAEGKLDHSGLARSSLLSLHGIGSWADPKDEDITRVWVDGRVANLDWDKQLSVEMITTYEGGARVHILAPMIFRGKLSDDDRWGTDALEVYHKYGYGDGAKRLSTALRLRLQLGFSEDAALWHSHWFDLEGTPTEHNSEETQKWPQTIHSPAQEELMGHQTETPFDQTEVYFAPFHDPGYHIIHQIHRLMQLKRSAPTERVTLHAAVFNMNDPGILEAIIEAHHLGVEVKLIMDGRKFRPRYEWYWGDERLLEEGVPVLGIMRMEDGAMHNKFILFNGEYLATGSMNWEERARYDNHENMIITSNRELIKAYARRFESLAGGQKRTRRFAHSLNAEYSVTFAPDEPSHLHMAQLIREAQSEILIAMFTAKDVWWDEEGHRTSLLSEVIKAHQRGVEVTMVLDHDIHEASEYYGILSDDDPIDEWLVEQGIKVVLADNQRNRYASMHHKFVIIDESITVTGAYNWYYDSAYRNDEDQLVIRDPQLAARYRDEFKSLLQTYAPHL